MQHQRIPDEEILFRRIPPTTPWFEPPDRISTVNFKLKPGEDCAGARAPAQSR